MTKPLTKIKGLPCSQTVAQEALSLSFRKWKLKIGLQILEWLKYCSLISAATYFSRNQLPRPASFWLYIILPGIQTITVGKTEKKLCGVLKVYSNVSGHCRSDATDFKQNCTALFEVPLLYFTVFKLLISFPFFPSLYHILLFPFFSHRSASAF